MYNILRLEARNDNGESTYLQTRGEFRVETTLGFLTFLIEGRVESGKANVCAFLRLCRTVLSVA